MTMPLPSRTVRAVTLPSGDVKVEVMAKDFGYGDRVDVTIWDQGERVGQLTVAAKHAGQSIEGKVDRWEAIVPARDLQRVGLGGIPLVATSTVWSADGSTGHPEYRKHLVGGRTFDFLVGKMPTRYPSSLKTVHGDLHSGALELDLLAQRLNVETENMLQAVRFTPKPGMPPFFGDASAITLVIYPVTTRQQGDHVYDDEHRTDIMTTVTLHRQGDGTYKADSPHELMAFAQYSEHVFKDANGNLQDKLSLTALRVTLESETAKDTRFEQGYVMPIK